MRSTHSSQDPFANTKGNSLIYSSSSQQIDFLSPGIIQVVERVVFNVGVNGLEILIIYLYNLENLLTPFL